MSSDHMHRSTFWWLSFALVFIILSVVSSGARAQQMCKRIMEQDQALDNFKDPRGYVTGKLGELGNVTSRGTGSQTMLLIPGLGFGGEVFAEFMAARESDFTMYAVTLAGFGNTPAPPSPPDSISFGEQTWTNSAYHALEGLIEKENLKNIIVVGHWLTGTQLALRLALAHPDIVKGVVIISGAPTFMPTDTTQYPARPALKMRVASIDQYMAPKWFKTVTRKTWDDNNFLPIDYAINPVRGLRLWRWAAEPALHVWVRYLCEFYAQDICSDLDTLRVPALLMKPGLDGIYHDPGNNYMQAYCHTGWDVLLPSNSHIESTTIPDSRVCMWFDQPEAFDSAFSAFIRKLQTD